VRNRAVPRTVRLLIVDDHAAARLGLRMRLGRERDLAVIGESGDAAGAMRLASQLRPDVVLVDLGLPDGDGIDLVARLREAAPGSACLILSIDDSRRNRARAAEIGVPAFIGKQQPTEVLLAAIRNVGSGGAP
jgi:DNA-binding NarL/FixJ family response regulator